MQPYVSCETAQATALCTNAPVTCPTHSRPWAVLNMRLPVASHTCQYALETLMISAAKAARVADRPAHLPHLPHPAAHSGTVTAIANANSVAINQAANASAAAVSAAIAAVCGGGNVTAAASALAQAVATATARAFASAQAQVSVQGKGQ
jgi:hypothetical protein